MYVIYFQSIKSMNNKAIYSFGYFLGVSLTSYMDNYIIPRHIIFSPSQLQEGIIHKGTDMEINRLDIKFVSILNLHLKNAQERH